jgi:Flp pilus assembly protein TadG
MKRTSRTFNRSADSIVRLRAGLAEFRANRQANVAIMFAVAAIPILSAVACALDYSMAMSLRTKIQAAADAATLAAVSVNSPLVAAASNMSADGNIANDAAFLTNFFQSGAPASPAATLSTASVVKTGNMITASATFSAQVPTSFLKIMGYQTLTLTGTSTASYAFAPYLDFYLLLDNTPSMGLPATQSDIDALIAGTKKYASTGGLGCAFACHDISAAESDPTNAAFDNFYQTAKDLGITKRIDVLASATQQLMTTAENTQTMNNQFKVAVYTFGTWGSTKAPSDVAKQASNNYEPYEVAPLSSSLKNAGSQAAQIDLMTVNKNNENNDRATNYDLMLPAINTLIKKPGTGQSVSSRKAVLFFVTDGMADEVDPGSCSGNLIVGQSRCIEPVKAALCQAIKDRGIQIAILYTTYLTLPSSGAGSDSWTNSNVTPYIASIAPAMQACASPGLYFEVTPTQGISQAMNALFQKVVSTAHITR